MTRYEEYIRAYPNSNDCVERLLIDLRRAIAGDGPHDRTTRSHEGPAINLKQWPTDEHGEQKTEGNRRD